MSYTTDPRRLGGVARLYGEKGAERLARSHVVVVGTGGVGSWAAEALARTGVGRLTLIDGDKSALSNTNRQLHAMDGNYGQYKVELLKARFALINPELEVSAITAFVTAENAERLLPKDADWVVDCIDDLKGKTVLVATAKRLGCKVVVSAAPAANAVRVNSLKRILRASRAIPSRQSFVPIFGAITASPRAVRAAKPKSSGFWP